MIKKSHIALAITLAFSTVVHAASVDIQNAGFESKWDGWTDSDPSAISSDAYSGNRSAKISGSSGKFTQDVSLVANTNYLLTAFVKGSGKIGATVNGQTYSSTGGGSNFTKVSVSFNSGNGGSATIFGQHGGKEGRFDSFALESTGSSDATEPTPPTTPAQACSGSSSLTIASATDNGTNDGHGPQNTIDDNLSNESRWSSINSGKTITYDLGKEASVKQLEIMWFKGNSRTSFFEVDTSLDNSSWTSVLVSGQSSGNSSSYETVNLLASQARYVRITGLGNSSNSWNSIIETNIIGCFDDSTNSGGGDNSGGGNNGGNSGGGNTGGNAAIDIELDDWYLGVPIDLNGDGKSDSISEAELLAGYEHSEWFYYAADGGLVFKAPVDAPKTSTNTSYTRSELREMLRRGDKSISTKGVNKNNWVFSTYSSSDKSAAGGIDGELKATLKVDHVTSTGSSSQIGRVIIGQIHAKDDEPARLYYRKLKGHTKGSIYLAHEPNGGKDQRYNLIGSSSSSASEPSDGIALGDVFSYSIKVTGNTLLVTVSRDGKADVVQEVDMKNSGYHTGSDQYMYFKAGVYNQNNTGNADDYVQATFYKIINSHDGYNF